MEKLFHNIMHQPVYFPSFLSEQGKSVLEGLLCRDPVQRLGCGKDDGEEVMRHPFFAGIDFEKLLNRTYQPPFKPKVVSPPPGTTIITTSYQSNGCFDNQEDSTDVRNFDKEFTNMPAVLTPESLSQNALTKDFQDFTFVSETGLSPSPLLARSPLPALIHPLSFCSVLSQ